jgi:hypothetical protein
MRQLETNVRILRDELLDKQAHIEKVISEKNSIQFQLENELNRSRALELIVQTRNVTDSDLESGKGGIRFRGSMGPRHVAEARSQTELVTRARLALDDIGMMLVSTLRLNPNFRIAFLMYVVLIHLWVVYVLYHFSTHLKV